MGDYMAKSKPKNINGLMKYLRDQKGMDIKGSSQKLRLRNMGYYHGYKGYRYIGTPSKNINFTKFAELESIYNFDKKLKALLYPHVMFIETALKNYVLEALVENSKSENFNDIYNTLLTDYKRFATKNKNDYKAALKKRLGLRDQIYRVQTKAYGNKNRIAEHYYQKDNNLPIWAIFELLSLGEFGTFVACIESNTRRNISLKLGIKQSDDSHAMLTERLIFTIKDLRNAIAHNDVIFDARFRKGSIDNQVINAVTNATGVKGITFETIVDYIILIVYMLDLFGLKKTEIKKFVREFEIIKEELRKEIPTSYYNQIIHSNVNNKLSQVKKFV